MENARAFYKVTKVNVIGNVFSKNISLTFDEAHKINDYLCSFILPLAGALKLGLVLGQQKVNMLTTMLF